MHLKMYTLGWKLISTLAWLPGQVPAQEVHHRLEFRKFWISEYFPQKNPIITTFQSCDRNQSKMSMCAISEKITFLIWRNISENLQFLPKFVVISLSTKCQPIKWAIDSQSSRLDCLSPLWLLIEECNKNNQSFRWDGRGGEGSTELTLMSSHFGTMPRFFRFLFLRDFLRILFLLYRAVPTGCKPYFCFHFSFLINDNVLYIFLLKMIKSGFKNPFSNSVIHTFFSWNYRFFNALKLL